MRGTGMGEKYYYLGTTAEGEHVAVAAELRDAQTAETTQHGPAPAGAKEFAMSGAIWSKRSRLDRERGADGYGQCIQNARAVVNPSGKLTRADIERLADIWERWHLNGLRAGCAHMDLPDDASYEARKEIRCPLTGYKYGSAWLFEPLPDGLWREVVEILAKAGSRKMNP